MNEHVAAKDYQHVIARAKRTQPETLILAAVRDYMRLRGWMVIRIQQGLGCHKGIADLVAMKDGRTVWLEIKCPKGRLSEHQDRFQAEVLRAGGEYVIARSIDDCVNL